MNDLEPLLAQMRQVAGPAVNDLQLQILVTLVTSFMGKKGGRPVTHNNVKLTLEKPVTAGEQTGLANINGGEGGASVQGLGLSGSAPVFSQPIRRRYNMMSAPQGFHEFWSLYPRRVAKQAAIKAWSRQIGADVKLTLLVLDALRWQVEHTFARCEEEKIPHAATWLNGKRWEDERQRNGVSKPNAHDPYQRLG